MYTNHTTIEQIDWFQSPGRALVEDPIVLVANMGRLKGATVSTKWTNQTYYQFLGIPYAEAPSGSRRFKVIKECKMFVICHNYSA